MDPAVTQARRLARRREPTRWGSVAVAKAGDLIVECDEALSGAESWQVTVESPALALSFLITIRHDLEEVRDFLTALAGPTKRTHVSIGRCVRLVADDELSGRVFLLIDSRTAHVRVNLSPEQAQQTAAALSEVLNQWVA